ncbi:MAG: S-layer homology domain-containing protein [Ruminiclostridium sp.]|nr:S-layer homology domain-containing protein [Ruminiclostridium sp.]
MKRKLFSLFLAAMLLTSVIQPALAAPGNISDLEGHWAQAEIETAVKELWVNGYPDGTFRPQGTITRAEFTKMLLAALRLKPESQTVQWMKDHACYREHVRNETARYSPILVLPTGHWFTTQGWKDAAIYSGILVPSDYTDYDFHPDQAISRYEIAVLTVRALGLVYPATHSDADDLPFTDQDSFQGWVRGYIREATNAGVLTGYPDGSFVPKAPATRAEAVVMVSRVLEAMEVGLDPNIQTKVRYSKYPNRYAETVTNQVRLQQVGDILYANILDIRTVQDRLRWAAGCTSIIPEKRVEAAWFPLEQRIEYDPIGSPTDIDHYQAGNAAFLYEGGSYTFPVSARMLYGEIMIPVYDFSVGETTEIWNGNWEESTRTITIRVSDPIPPIS